MHHDTDALAVESALLLGALGAALRERIDSRDALVRLEAEAVEDDLTRAQLHVQAVLLGIALADRAAIAAP